MLDFDLGKKLNEMDVSVTKFADMAGISQPAMRLIAKGVNKPNPETEKAIRRALAKIKVCPCCKRALRPEDVIDDNPGNNSLQGQTPKTEKAVSGLQS